MSDAEKIEKARERQSYRDAEGREHKKPEPPPAQTVRKGAWTFYDVFTSKRSLASRKAG